MNGLNFNARNRGVCLYLRCDPQLVEEEAEGVDAKDDAGHVLPVVDVRRLWEEDLKKGVGKFQFPP